MDARERALAAAMAETDPSSLGAGERLRREFGADLAAWASTQAALRLRALGRFAKAGEMWFTRDGLEQATREPVACWRARRFAAAGVSQVWDLGCGIGSDAMAFARAGLAVVAIDADPATAEAAAHNLALVGGEARVGRAEETRVPEGAAVFLDPARRTARGRTWRMEDLAPPWEFVAEQLAGPRFAAVKLGPGVPKEIIPKGLQACWVSHRGDVVEASLWNRLPPGPRAVVIDESGTHELGPETARSLEVGPVGRYIVEPDGAVIRAGLLGGVVADAWLLDGHVAYLSTDREVDSPFATCFEVLESLPYDVKRLRSWLREHEVGTVEIKKRAIDVDPAALRRRLKPKGPNAITLVVARTTSGTRALAVRRLPRRPAAKAID